MLLMGALMSDELTPQLRAVRVYRMLLERPRTARELQAATGLSERGTYYLLESLSASGGIPIYSDEGFHRLLDCDSQATLESLHDKLRIAVLTPEEDDGTSVMARLTINEVKAVTAILKHFLHPYNPN